MEPLVTELNWTNGKLEDGWERLTRVSLCTASGATLLSVAGYWHGKGRFGLRLGGPGLTLNDERFEGRFAILMLNGQYQVTVTFENVILSVSGKDGEDFVIRLQSARDPDFWREYVLPRAGKPVGSGKLKPRQRPSPAVLAADARRYGPRKRPPSGGEDRMDCLIH